MKAIKKILLTGASGTVGYEVYKILVNNPDISLTVFDIDTPKARKLFKKKHSNLELIFGDISRPLDLFRLPDGFDVIIHLAAMIPPAADDFPQKAQQVNVEGTRLLLAHASLHSPQAFFLYSSSISVYGDRVSQPYITVNDPLNVSARDLYAQTKVEAEQIVQNSGMDFSIFRLTAIMKNHKISKLMFHMPLNTQLEICTPEDTARAFAYAIDKRNVLNGQIFNLGGGEKCRIEYRDFLSRSFQLFGLGKLNFPKHSFAYKNFHCGLYADGNLLEDILHFRQDTMESYFQKTKRTIPFFVRWAGFVFAPMVKWMLTLSSEPLQALKKNNRVDIKHYFLS